MSTVASATAAFESVAVARTDHRYTDIFCERPPWFAECILNPHACIPNLPIDFKFSDWVLAPHFAQIVVAEGFLSCLVLFSWLLDAVPLSDPPATSGKAAGRSEGAMRCSAGTVAAAVGWRREATVGWRREATVLVQWLWGGRGGGSRST